MKPPKVNYIHDSDVDIAYQVFGEGPVDLYFGRPFPMNLDVEWDNPAIERFYRRLASFARVVLADLHPGGLTGVRMGHGEPTSQPRAGSPAWSPFSMRSALSV